MSNLWQSPNNSQPFGPTPTPPQQPVIMVATNRNRPLIIIGAVLAVLVVVAIGLVAWVVFGGSRTYQGHAPVLLKNQDEAATETSANNAAPVIPQAAAPAAPVTVTVPAPAGNSGASNNSSNSGDGGYGALTIPSTQCGSYAYSGTNGTDFVSVCSDGGYTYKAYVNGGYLERPASAAGSGRFVVDASPHTITVSGAAVFVQDSDGNTVLTVPMTTWRAGG